MSTDKYPAWACKSCGSKYGRLPVRVQRVATYHWGTCDVCGKKASVTEPRDFGHLKPEWVNEREERSNG